MANRLTIIFNAVENISSRLASIASIGSNAVSGFQRIEDAANQAFSSTESGAEEAASAFDRAASSADALADTMNRYEQEADSAAGASQQLADAQDEAVNELNEIVNAADEASDELANLEDAAEAAGRRTEEFGNGTERARDHLGRFTRSSREAEESVDGLGRGTSELASLLASVGIVAALKEIGQAFADCAAQGEIFETSIAKLQTISGGDSIGQLQGEILALSNDTGQAADALADTAYNAISAGTAVEDSVNMAATASKLAVAGFTDTSSALSVLTTAINSYGDAAGTAEHISDSLVTVQNLGVTTVAELSQQMGKAISTASAYNVSLENLESGYISITKSGINAAEGTTYLASMFNELGNTGSEISKVIQKETGKTFGQLMNDGQSVADVLGIVYEKTNQNAEAMMNLWGSAEAGKAANAIISQGLDTFNSNLETLETSVGITKDAYAVMADTTAYAHEKMDNAAKNLQVTIGSQLNPTLEKLYDAGADILIGISEFIEKNPIVLKGITALGVGLATSVGILTAVSAAENAAALAAEFFNSALLKNPVLWLVGGVAALTVAFYELKVAWDEATDATDELTFASREAESELAALNQEYEKACEVYGQNSVEAGKLALKIDELNRKYEEGGETIGEFRDRIEELGNYLEENQKSYDENAKSINDMYGSGMMLVSELQALRSQSQLTDGELALMNSIVGELNNTYSGLGLTVEEASGRMNYSIADLYGYVTEQTDLMKREEASQALVGILSKYDEIKTTRDEAASELEKARDEYEKSVADWQKEHPVKAVMVEQGKEMNWDKELGKAWDAQEQSKAALQEASHSYTEAIGQVQEYCAVLGYTSEETDELISKLAGSSEAVDEASASFSEAGQRTVGFEEAVQTAVESVRSEVDELAAAYDEAYTSALSSIEGQYNLWDKVGTVAKTSMSDLNVALDSQTQYWDDYANNLDTLSEKAGQIDGLSDVLKKMDDGSEESASALAAMANASDEQLGKMVEKYQSLQEAQSKTAGEMADLESEFSSKLNEMSNRMTDSVTKMNMESDAAEAAKKTIQGYINGIRGMIPSVTTAAAAASKAASDALGSTYTGGKVSVPASVEGNASGTINSDDVYIAGENGPELIISKGGDTVFPTSETDRIISAVSGNDDNPQITDNSVSELNSKGMSAESGSTSSIDKTVTIRLEGSGSVGVGSGVSSEGLWDSVKNNLKQVVMAILQEEIYEEGTGAYEY